MIHSKETRFSNRTVFTDLNAKKRTDLSFASFQKVQHHKPDTLSPLKRAQYWPFLSIISEYMYLVCLGATLRLLLHWLCGKRAVKISMQMADTILNDLKNLAANVAIEFGRKTRSLKDFDRWKATDFRLFLCCQ